MQLVEVREAGEQMVTEFNAQSIIVRFSATVPDEVARQKIDALRARIEGGEDFAKVAREASDDTLTRNDGGNMGWFQAGQWGTAIGNIVQSLRDGELSQPFRSDVGWHVIKRLGTRQQDVTETNRRNQAREIIGTRKSEEEFERFLRQLRWEAFVESRLAAP